MFDPPHPNCYWLLYITNSAYCIRADCYMTPLYSWCFWTPPLYTTVLLTWYCYIHLSESFTQDPTNFHLTKCAKKNSWPMESWAPLGTTLYIPQVMDAAICLCPSSLEIEMKSEDQSRTILQGEIFENAPKRKRKRPKHPFWGFQPFGIPGCCHGQARHCRGYGFS